MSISIDSPEPEQQHLPIDGDKVLDAMAVRLGRSIAQFEMSVARAEIAADIIGQQQQRIQTLETELGTLRSTLAALTGEDGEPAQG